MTPSRGGVSALPKTEQAMSRKSALKMWQRRQLKPVTFKRVIVDPDAFGLGLTIWVHEQARGVDGLGMIHSQQINLLQCTHFCLAPGSGKHGFSVCCVCYDRAGHGLCRICYLGPNPRNYARHEDLD